MSLARFKGLSMVSILLLVAIALTVGWQTGSWHQNSLKAATCAVLSRQAEEIALNLRPQVVRQLTSSDPQSREEIFARIQLQLTIYSRMIPGLSIYCLTLRNNAWLHGPSSGAALMDAPTGPGSPFSAPRAQAGTSWMNKTIVTVGPEPQNGYGHFSAFVPVFDLPRDEVIMVIGLDLPAEKWQSAARRVRAVTMGIALMVAAVALIAAMIIRRNSRHHEERRPWLRHLEAVIVLVFGLAFTATLVLWMTDRERAQQSQVFEKICDNRIEEIRGPAAQIIRNVEAVARFIQQSRLVERREFTTFVEPLMETPFVQGLMWIPAVRSFNKGSVEELARMDGLDDFIIWEKDDQGRRIAAGLRLMYYPVYYCVSAADYAAPVGFNLGSENASLSIMEKSIRSGLSEACLPATHPAGVALPAQMVIYYPVYADVSAPSGSPAAGSGEKELLGFVGCTLEFQSFFKTVFNRYQDPETMLEIDLIGFENNTHPLILASYPDNAQSTRTLDQLTNNDRLNDRSYLRPVFIAGSVLTVAARPSPLFYKTYPVGGSWLVAVIGTALSVILTLLFGFLRNRQVDLENVVRQRTAALEKSEERLAFALSGADLAVWDWHIPSGHLTIDTRWAGMLGYDPREIEPHVSSWEKLVHPDDLSAILSLIQKHLHSGQEVYACEYRLRHKDGQWVWIQDRGRVMQRGLQSEPLRMLGTHLDISERKQAEEALHRSQAKINSIFSAAPIGIGMVIHRVIQEANDYLCWMTGRTREELVGKNARMLYFSDEEYNRVGEVKYQQINEKGTGSIETCWQHKDGRPVHIILSSTPLDPTDLGKGVTFTAFDITARKQLEEEQRMLDHQIQQTQKLESLGVLAGGIAHDFNNILMAVLGHAELALQELPPLSTARPNLREIALAARRAGDLCRQMLAYAGKGSFALEEVDLSSLIEEMAHLIQTSLSKKAILNLHLDSGLPPILADPSQIRQIVLNLIINASEAIGDISGVITVNAGAMRCDQEYLDRTELKDALIPGVYVYLEVADTGCGMDQATRARIFEPFFTTKFTGRGLGLAAVMGIVRAHQGALKISSEPGRGTTFKILFPSLDVSQRKQTQPEGDVVALWKGEGTILLADDEESLRTLGARMLERLGLKVITAENGLEALELYRAHGHRIDLVLLDLTMPILDGGQAFGELLKLNPDVRVVLASGYSADDVGSRYAGKGLAGVLQKPFTSAKLSELLSRLMPAAPVQDAQS